MSSFFHGGGGGYGGGGHRPQYICYYCNRVFSPLPSTPSSDVSCPNCNGDSFEELQNPLPFRAEIPNFPLTFPNMPPEIAAAVAATGGLTVDINLSRAPLFMGGQPVGVVNPATATFQVPAADFANGNFEKQLGQFVMSTVTFPGAGMPPQPAANSESEGNENIESDSDSDEEDYD